MKVLITGGSGLLGKSLLETKQVNTDLILTYHNNIYGLEAGETWVNMDITNTLNTSQLIHKYRPDVIIHCAAIGSVDYAESHYDKVMLVNSHATHNLVNMANEIGATFVHISTNAVYSGNEPPYDELSPHNPINAYGAIKSQADRNVSMFADRYLIIRPFLLYGWPFQAGRDNWASKIVKEVAIGNSLKMVNDHIWQPTYAPDCAAAIWKLLFQVEDNETFNIASHEKVTLYDFAIKVCEVFDLDSDLIEPVSSDYFPTIAKRPQDTSYNLTKMVDAGIFTSDVYTGLARMRAAGLSKKIYR